MPYRLQAQLNEHASILVETESLGEMAQALQFFKLIDGPRPMPTDIPDGSVDPTPTPVMDAAAGKAPRRRKTDAPVEMKPVNAEVTSTPATGAESADATKTDTSPASSQTTAGTSDAGNAAQPQAAANPTAATPASSNTPAVSPAEAAEAVRAYGAKHGIVPARELLAKFGFAKTGDITADKAAEVAAAAKAGVSEEL